MEHIAIVIADENSQVRNLVVARLEREPIFEIVGLADNSTDALACILETHPRLLLIDPRLTDGMAMEMIRRLHLEAPDTVIVVLTAYCETAQRMELAKLGVRFILNKGLESYKLVEVLLRAAQSTTDIVSNHSSNEELLCPKPA